MERFATANNTHLPRFNPEFHSPGSEGVNAMTRHWAGENNFVNPPWGMLDKVAQKLRLEGAAATVVAPFWLSATWWKELQDLASEIIRWPASPGLFLPGLRGSAASVGPPGRAAAIVRPTRRPPT